MKGISLSSVLLVIALGYFLFTAWSLYEVFFPPSCKSLQKCLTPNWSPDDQLSLEAHFLASKGNSNNFILRTDNFSILEGISSTKNVTPPASVYRNGTIKARIIVSSTKTGVLWSADIPLITYREPLRTAFNLLSNQNTSSKSSNITREKDEIFPVNFWLSTLRIYLLKTPVSFTSDAIPPEVIHLLRLTSKEPGASYLPLLYVNPELQKTNDWIPVPEYSLPPYPPLMFTISVEPLSIGKFRLRCMLAMMTDQLRSYGLRPKDIDEVRSLLVDTNFYFLLTTIFVSVFHLLFDFLAFKNDIAFWRRTESTAGLSMRTVVWRLVSSFIIFLHLWEERSSMLVIIPMGISTCIELWKLCRITKLSVSLRHGLRWGTRSHAEQTTDQLDAQFMYYLVCFMIPLCLAGSVYSLLYMPHRSWYSWCLQTLVNGVYAFGFLLMTPQLFLNYRLKSVAHLPWKALTYKAFNTFIDDFFAFIITMPTAHRIACLRDDVVFVIYLYQRWLYPVDKSRANEFGQRGDENEQGTDRDTSRPVAESERKKISSGSLNAAVPKGKNESKKKR